MKKRRERYEGEKEEEKPKRIDMLLAGRVINLRIKGRESLKDLGE